MIEIIYNKEKEKAVGNEEYFCVPKNIRQMGDVPKENKIYLEDYVHTFLTSDWKEEEPQGKISILLGKYNWKDGVAYIFVKSAVMVEGIPVTGERFPLDDTVWGTVYEEMKAYFPGQEVIGWYLSLPDGGLRVTDAMVRAHLKHFGGNDKILLLADPYERESNFYVYKNNRMEKITGYYIFYEKNDRMQEYMLVKKPELQTAHTGKIEDRAVQDFRKIIARKNETRGEKKGGFPWATAACVGIAAVSLGVSAFWLLQREKTGNDAKVLSAEETASIMNDLLIRESDLQDGDMVLLTPEISPGDSSSELTNQSGADNSSGKNTDSDLNTGSNQNGASDSNTGTDQNDSSDSNTGTGQNDSSDSNAGTGQNGSSDSNAGSGQNTASDSNTGLDQNSSANTQNGTNNTSSNQNTGSNEESQETSLSVYTKYTVRKGDTISQISMRYYGDFSKITEICKINNMLETDVIYPGQTILLP